MVASSDLVHGAAPTRRPPPGSVSPAGGTTRGTTGGTARGTALGACAETPRGQRPAGKQPPHTILGRIVVAHNATTLGLLWAAAAGHGSYRATWMHVTDAENSDNLGLVEALGRGAGNILVLDAGRDSANTWFSLAEAMAAALADEGVHVALNPTTMTTLSGGRGPVTLAPGQVARPWARGTFTRDPAWAGAAARPAYGQIWVCKPGWWQGAPWDIRAYAAGHPTYPDRSPGEQLYDGAEFDSYRKLGIATVLDAYRAGLDSSISKRQPPNNPA